MANPLSLVTSLPSTADTVDLLVKIAGRPLDAAIAASVLDVSVQQTLGQPSHLTLRLAAWDPDTDQFTLVDDPRLQPGSSVERQAKYEKTTYAGIVRTIAQTIYKIAVDARDDVDNDPENPVVFQENKSDFAFLTKLAMEIQYELFVDAGGKKLVFRKSQLTAPVSLTLNARQDLVQFSARLDAAGQIGGVEVRSFDSDNKKRIQVVLDNPDSLDRRYGSVPSRSLITDVPLLTQEEAQAHAEAELLRIRANYLTATATCFGRTELRPGLMIHIAELGDRFGGDFHVTSATHSLSPSGGFRTSFELEGVTR